MAIAGWSAPASASDETAALRSQLEQVKRVVADLESRLSALEADQARASAPAGRPSVATAAPTATASAAAATPAAAPVAKVASAPATVAAAPAAAVTSSSGPAAQASPPAMAAKVASAPVAAAPAIPAQTAEPPPVPRAAWRRVHAGSTQEEVSQLLGPPTRSFELSGRLVWYYVYPEQGAGSVFFDGSGHVSSLQMPSKW